MKSLGRPAGAAWHRTAPGLLHRLAAARDAAKLSQAETAALIDKSPSHYSKIERGVVGLEARHALTLCNRFGLSLAELLETRA